MLSWWPECMWYSVVCPVVCAGVTAYGGWIAFWVVRLWWKATVLKGC